MSNDNTDYILFLDESTQNKHNPNLVLGGIIISRKKYKETLIPNILKCKNILGNPHIIFHYTDLLKKQKNFSFMCGDTDMCNNFWDELKQGLEKTDFNIVASYIDIGKYNRNYSNAYCHDAYELLFSTIINNYIYFLIQNKSRGSILFESREETQNRRIQQYYFNILKNGTNIYKPEAIQKHITTTSFLVKEDNCIGLQVADMVVNNCMKHINKIGIKHGMWDIFEPKIYDGNCKDTESYGITKLF